MGNQKPLKERRKEAELLVQQIDSELASAKNAVADCISELSTATKAKSDFQKLIPQINRLSANVNTALKKIRSDRDRLSRLLTTVNNFYNKKYAPLANKINNPEIGLNARLKEGNQFAKELLKVKANNEKQFDLIKQLTSDFRKKLGELKTIETTLRRINSKILDHEKTISQKRTKIEEDAIKVEAATNNIIDSEKKISEKEQKITDLHKESENAYNEIIVWHSEADKTLDKIRKIYEIAAGSGLGGEFDKRRKLLDTDLKRWREHLFFTTITLFFSIVGLFILQLMPVDWDMTKLKFDANFYVRFLITSPFIYYLFFVTSQYNRTKALLEKYSFKTALALSIEAHINLLTGIDHFHEKERLDKIADFILDGFNRIYDAPYEKQTEKKGSSDVSELINTLMKEIKRLPTKDKEH